MQWFTLGRISHTPECQVARSPLQGMEESDSKQKSSTKCLCKLAHGVQTHWWFSGALSRFHLPQTTLADVPASFLQHVGPQHLSSSEYQTAKRAEAVEGRNRWVKLFRAACLPNRQVGSIIPAAAHRKNTLGSS